MFPRVCSGSQSCRFFVVIVVVVVVLLKFGGKMMTDGSSTLTQNAHTHSTQHVVVEGFGIRGWSCRGWPADRRTDERAGSSVTQGMHSGVGGGGGGGCGSGDDGRRWQWGTRGFEGMICWRVANGNGTKFTVSIQYSGAVTFDTQQMPQNQTKWKKWEGKNQSKSCFNTLCTKRKTRREEKLNLTK